MRSHSLLKWLFIALLHPLDATAIAAQQRLPTFHYAEPDVPASINRLPAARPDLFTLSRTPAAKANRTPASPTTKLRFGLNFAWKVGEGDFGVAQGPISANLLRVPGKAQRELERALKVAGKGDWAKAEQHLQKSLEIYPAFSAAHHNLGVIAIVRGDTAGGEALIERALALDEHNLYALFALAQVRLSQADDAAARRYIERFLTLSPEDPHGLALLAAVEIRRGRIDEALRIYARLGQKEHRSLSDFHLLAGSLYEVKSDSNRAVAEYKEFLRENPKAHNQAEVAEVIGKLQTFMAAN